MSFISVKERASVTIKGSHCHVVTLTLNGCFKVNYV